MRLVIVQYAGDYREAVQRFSQGGEETYYAQRYSVDAVAKMAKNVEEAVVICGFTEEPYNEVVQNGVRAIGAGFTTEFDTNKIIKLIEEQKPTHLVIRTAIRPIFDWAIQHKVSTIAMFAESISLKGLRSKWRNFRLARLLNNKQVEWVGSYGVNTSKALAQIGVNSDKIIPWQFIVTETPEALAPRHLRENANSWELFYIGSMIEQKGVGEILEAVAHLRANNFPVNLKLAGRDNNDFFLNKARNLKIEEFVEFLGIVPNKTVVPLMREADLVLVPSRQDYPEGFPLAITHALCAHTPVVASDHPMFLDHLKSGVNSMIFPAGNSVALATSIKKLLSEPELYWDLSVASYETWKGLQVPVTWAEMIERWLDNSPESRQWLFEYRLSSGRYN